MREYVGCGESEVYKECGIGGGFTFNDDDPEIMHTQNHNCIMVRVCDTSINVFFLSPSCSPHALRR